MISFRIRSNRVVVFLAGLVVQGVLNLGAPAVAHAQAPSGISSSGQTQSGAPPKSWRQRHPVLFPTLIGTAVGAAAGCALGAAAPSSETVSCAFLAPPYGLLGAAVGVVPGMITEKRNERDPLSFDDVRRRVKAGTNVIVIDQSRRQTIGKVVAVAADSVTMRSMDGTTTTLAGQTSTWHLTSDSLKNGMLIGAAFGAAVAVANYKGEANAAGAITAVPIWSLIFTLVDRGFKHEKLIVGEQPASSSASVTLLPWFGPRSGGFALSASF
jgi:hypothetical protein